MMIRPFKMWCALAVSFVGLTTMSGCSVGSPSPYQGEGNWTPPAYVSRTPIVNGWSLIGLGYWQAATVQLRDLTTMRWAYDPHRPNGRPGWVVAVQGTVYPGPPVLPPGASGRPYAGVAVIAIVGHTIVQEGVTPLSTARSFFQRLAHDPHYHAKAVARLHPHGLWWTPAMVSWAIQGLINPPDPTPWPKRFTWGLTAAWRVRQTYPSTVGTMFIVVRFRRAPGRPYQYWTLDATNGTIIFSATVPHSPPHLPRQWHRSHWLAWRVLR